MAEKEYRFEDIPFYEKGKPPRVDLWDKVDYLDEYERIWGKKWGAPGIGKLREVALVRPTEYEIHPFFLQDPTYCMIPKGEPISVEKWQKDHDAYAQILQGEGVIVNYIEYPDPPISIYGPMYWMCYPDNIMVIRGGAIIPRYGMQVFSKGSEPVLAKWLVNHGCPILLTIIGKGINELGGSRFLCEDVVVTALSVSYNREGLDQFLPVFYRTGGKEALIMNVPGAVGASEWQWPKYGFHPDMIIAPLDIGKVLIYPPLCDYETIRWLRARNFELIEVASEEEQKLYMPPNLTILEPGKVIMHAGAKETISRVRRAGVKVIETEMSEMLKGGVGGVCCQTMQLIRDPGPGLEDMK